MVAKDVVLAHKPVARSHAVATIELDGRALVHDGRNPTDEDKIAGRRVLAQPQRESWPGDQDTLDHLVVGRSAAHHSDRSGPIAHDVISDDSPDAWQSCRIRSSPECGKGFYRPRSCRRDIDYRRHRVLLVDCHQ